MKNFPHQISNIPKLVAALKVYQDLVAKGADTYDDSVFGYALVAAHLYKFIDQKDESPDGITARIKAEKEKSPQRQGACTAAREIRRFFGLAHFIDENGITKMGKHILDAGIDITNPVVQHLWHNAMLNVVLPSTNDPSSESHPYQVLLNIVKARPNLNQAKLALALEAENDSAEELRRVLQIADAPEWTKLVNCSLTQLQNAVKILPAIARQIGDITSEGRIRQKKNIVKPAADRQQSEEIEELICYNQEALAQESPETFSYSGKPKAKQRLVNQGQWKLYPRDRMVAVNALVHANHRCEIEATHWTFIRRSNDKPYTEPHHLVPLAFSDNFDVSLDVEENVVSLCSTCHNRIHYGKDAAELVETLYNQRKELLQQVGIEVTLEELRSMY